VDCFFTVVSLCSHYLQVLPPLSRTPVDFSFRVCFFQRAFRTEASLFPPSDGAGALIDSFPSFFTRLLVNPPAFPPPCVGRSPLLGRFPTVVKPVYTLMIDSNRPFWLAFYPPPSPRPCRVNFKCPHPPPSFFLSLFSPRAGCPILFPAPTDSFPLRVYVFFYLSFLHPAAVVVLPRFHFRFRSRCCGFFQTFCLFPARPLPSLAWLCSVQVFNSASHFCQIFSHCQFLVYPIPPGPVRPSTLSPLIDSVPRLFCHPDTLCDHLLTS